MYTYVLIFVFAVLEGEIYYSQVCADAVAGKLPWVPVLIAGALGGAARHLLGAGRLLRRLPGMPG